MSVCLVDFFRGKKGGRRRLPSFSPSDLVAGRKEEKEIYNI